VPDRFEVRPDELTRAAIGLRAEAQGADEARGRGSAALQSAADSAGEGPLAGAAIELAAQVDKVIGAVLRGLDDTAAAISTSATAYSTTDAAESRRIADTPIPGLDGPR
jgi:uncharacterized membrane protein